MKLINWKIVLRDIKHLETENINKLIFKFSVPAVIGMLANASYNIVDRIFVGQGVGSLAISGVTIIFPLVIVVLAFCMLVGIGATAQISIRLGEKNKSEAEHILGNALSLSLIFSLALVLITILFMDNIFYLFGAEENIIQYTRDYTKVVLWGIPFQLISFTLNAIIRGEGNPRMAMATMIIGAILNVFLDWLFIFPLSMGIKGAALATIIGQFISMIWVLYYFLSKKSLLKLKLKNLKLDTRIIKVIFAVGVSPFAMQIASSIVITIYNQKLMQFGGHNAVATIGICHSIAMFFMMPIFGINQGLQPIIGYNHGAKHFHRVRSILFRGMTIATIICTLLFFLTIFMAEQIVWLFAKDDIALLSMGSHAMRIFNLMFPIVGFQVILSAYFQATGNASKAIIMTLTRQIIFIIPAIFILSHLFGLDGLWLTSPVCDSMSGVIAFAFLLIELSKLNKKIKENTNLSI